VRDAVFIGMCLAAAVLLLFLRNGKVTLIAILTVPAALAATILLLKVLHGSFNIMTLGAWLRRWASSLMMRSSWSSTSSAACARAPKRGTRSCGTLR